MEAPVTDLAVVHWLMKGLATHAIMMPSLLVNKMACGMPCFEHRGCTVAVFVGSETLPDSREMETIARTSSPIP